VHTVCSSCIFIFGSERLFILFEYAKSDSRAYIIHWRYFAWWTPTHCGGWVGAQVRTQDSVCQNEFSTFIATIIFKFQNIVLVAHLVDFEFVFSIRMCWCLYIWMLGVCRMQSGIRIRRLIHYPATSGSGGFFNIRIWVFIFLVVRAPSVSDMRVIFESTCTKCFIDYASYILL